MRSEALCEPVVGLVPPEFTAEGAEVGIFVYDDEIVHRNLRKVLEHLKTQPCRHHGKVGGPTGSHAAALAAKSGFGSQTVRATGRRGSGCGCGNATTPTTLATRRKR